MTTSTKERPIYLTESQESLLETMQMMLDSQTPNFLRLYLNPWVAQTCLVLNQIAQPLIHRCHPELNSRAPEPCPSFLANSREEAISGAVKLARYHLNLRARSQKPDLPHAGRSPVTLLVDPDHRFPFFAGWSVTAEHHLDFIPAVLHTDGSDLNELLTAPHNIQIVVLAGLSAVGMTSNSSLSNEGSSHSDGNSLLQGLISSPDVLVIRCCDVPTARQWAALEGDKPNTDIVVFDESFTDCAVPFSAFTAGSSLFKSWMSGAMSMFHSTTFQPNTISTLHFMKCARRQFPRLIAELNPLLNRLESEIDYRHVVYNALFSPPLSKLIQTIGFDRCEPRVDGHDMVLTSQRIFDGVAGVACSVRGHNPRTFCNDVRHQMTCAASARLEASTGSSDGSVAKTSPLHDRLREELTLLTGLPHFVPAVSGGSAVEQALQIALTAQASSGRSTVVIMRGGFGGKTLGALTGTWKKSYRQNVGPLYRDVVDVDPFAPNAVDQLQRVVAEHRVAVVQLEPVQGVGGVRAIPGHVIQEIQSLREQHGFLILADEVQTGMYRTGPFLRSHDIGLTPDLVTIGKGTSDMMFPFALTLFNPDVASRLEAADVDPASWFTSRFGYEVGYASVLNTLQSAARDIWEGRVRRQGNLFRTLLTEGLAGLPHVKDVRVFGMLIGIELNAPFLMSVLGVNGRRLSKSYALQMLKAKSNPILIGFCQYEPQVFKLTPGLLMSDDEIHQVAERICTSLRRSPLQVVSSAVISLLQPYFRRFRKLPSDVKENLPCQPPQIV